MSVIIHPQVEPATRFQRLMGNVKTGIILKDVSLAVHCSEVLAVLGSKGSGKKALLDVISRRVQGPTRGQILLNGAPMSLSLFQQRCGYVTHKCDMLPGLTVQQTLQYTATKVRVFINRVYKYNILIFITVKVVSNQILILN